MYKFFQQIFERHPVKSRRTLEMLPGFLSWLIILSPLWGSFLIPAAMAYFILFFDVYWFYKSFHLVVTAYIASKKIKQCESEDWMAKAEKLPDIEKVHHMLIIPNYGESTEKIRQTLT